MLPPRGDELVGDRDRPRHLPIVAAALAAGGHLRVGMEDNLMLRQGPAGEHNGELVTRAAQLATLMQRPPMSTTEARALLGVKDRSHPLTAQPRATWRCAPHPPSGPRDRVEVGVSRCPQFAFC